MSIAPGTYTLGPGSGELLVRTGRSGAAAKAGHDLLIEVTTWEATLQVGEDAAQSSLQLTADGGSLVVREGSGGIQALGENDKKGIRETIDTEILKRSSIAFSSSAVSGGDAGLHIDGTLEMLGRSAPIAFELAETGEGSVSAEAVVAQTAFGLKPYSALFGTLKVSDEVRVAFSGTLSA